MSIAHLDVEGNLAALGSDISTESGMSFSLTNPFASITLSPESLLAVLSYEETLCLTPHKGV